MSKNKLSFAEAIAYMTANPGREVKSPTGYFYYLYDGKFVYYSDNIELAARASFGQDAVIGQWTIPEEKEELPEVEVVAYMDEDGYVALYSKNSLDHEDAEEAANLTKCKIKFNQVND